MARTVTTDRTSTASGAPRVLAKSGGKQLTHKWDDSKSADWNPGTAAGALLVAKFNFCPLDVDMPLTGTSSPDGQHQTFTIGG